MKAPRDWRRALDEAAYRGLDPLLVVVLLVTLVVAAYCVGLL